jgi:hypothetical protein
MEKSSKITESSLDLYKCYICGLPIIAEKAHKTKHDYGEVLCYGCKNRIEAVDKNHVRDYLSSLIGLRQ